MFDNLVRKTPLKHLVGLLVALLALSVLGITPAAANAATPKLNLTLNASSWTNPAEKAEMQEWIKPEGVVQKTVAEEYGPPKETINVTVTKAETGHAGEYYQPPHEAFLTKAERSVLVHEEEHATRDQHILSCSTWEEGLARAGEKEVMYKLAAKGIVEEGYDTTHNYGYEVYADNDNTEGVGAAGCDIYAPEELTLLRYDQAGKAFWEILQEDPAFIKQFDAKLFTYPNGDLSQLELAAIAEEVQPTVEGQPMSEWIERQHIFDEEAGEGCYAFIRANQYTADLYCIEGGEIRMVPNAKITMTISDMSGTAYKAKELTSSYGWVTFSPEVPVNAGRLKVVVTAKSPHGTVKATAYRQSGAEEGIFGVVVGPHGRKANTGTVTISSPTGQFPTVIEPVASGAFVAPGLEKFRGQAVLEYSGENLAGKDIVTKDEAPDSVEIAAEKVKTK